MFFFFGDHNISSTVPHSITLCFADSKKGKEAMSLTSKYFYI